MRDDIGKIRSLIGEGKSDAEIEMILRADQEADGDLGWSNPKRTLKALARTMRRAVVEDRGVAAAEVLRQLTLFRVLWEEAAANAEVAKVEADVLQILSLVTSSKSVADAYAKLFADMSCLANRTSTLTSAERAARKVVEKAYLREVDSVPVICLARAASAVADATLLAFSTLDGDAHYRLLFTEDVLLPSVDLLIVERPTWQEVLRGAKLPMLQKNT